ncbi:MAG TPA: hypothetical protein P5121_39695 [Caldilineaceae bacterium]|nr:hypothetical protein [Caldilineaceae bacterium]
MRLAGMIAAQRVAAGLVLPPLRQQQFDQVVAAARQLVSPKAAAAAWTTGSAMSVEEAISLVI